MSKHTPMPWRWWDRKSRPNPRPKNYNLAHLYGPGGTTILTMYGGEGNRALGSEPEDIANAEFIIRACNSHDELLAVCIQALETIRWYKENGLSGQDYNIHELEGAIANAKA